MATLVTDENKRKLQEAIGSKNMGYVVYILKEFNNREFNNRELPNDDTIREIVELKIPGQRTILEDIYALPDDEFKRQLMKYLKVEELSFKGGKKKCRKTRKTRKSRKSRKTRTRSQRRYRK